MSKKIKVEKKILNENDQIAANIQQQLDKHHIYSINIMASPGAGKTSLVVKTIRSLKNNHRLAVIDGDVSDIDVQTLKQENIPVVLANTGGACHLDATMMVKAVDQLDLTKLDFLIVENVGNLICPANFSLGTTHNIVIASVPEGHDKPHKYPGMFLGADVVIINKMDYTQIEDFDMDFFQAGIRKVNPTTQIIPLSCKTGEGIDTWIKWLINNLKSL